MPQHQPTPPHPTHSGPGPSALRCGGRPFHEVCPLSAAHNPALRLFGEYTRPVEYSESPDVPRETTARRLARILLGSFMTFAGVAHLTFARTEFQAQVPTWVPVPPDVTVLASGVVEITLGGSLILLKNRRVAVGLLLAGFFVAIFPGNIAQWIHHRDAFGLNSDRARFIRLLFQPVLIAWALWSTGAWRVLLGLLRGRTAPPPGPSAR